MRVYYCGNNLNQLNSILFFNLFTGSLIGFFTSNVMLKGYYNIFKPVGYIFGSYVGYMYFLSNKQTLHN